MSKRKRKNQGATDETRSTSTLSNPDPWLISAITTGDSITGISVSETTALNLSSVYACVNIISSSIASLPIHVYRRLPGGGKTKAVDHPAYQLLHTRPNPRMTPYQWKQFVAAALGLRGNSYVEIVRDNSGDVAQLWPFKPDDGATTVVVNPDGSLTYVFYIRGARVVLHSNEIMHLTGLSTDGVFGLSPITSARDVLGVALAEATHAGKFFANSARPNGILTSVNKLNDAQKIALKESWNSAYGGAGNSSKTALLEGGVDWKAISLSNEDSQFLESRRFSLEEIARIWNVPKFKLMVDASGLNSEQQAQQFYSSCILPYLVQLEQQLNYALFGMDPEYYVEFSIEGLLRADYATRIAAYQIGVFSGIFTPNEVRSWENLSPVPEGDQLLVQGAMIKLADVGTNYGVDNTPEDPAQPDPEDDAPADATPGDPVMPDGAPEDSTRSALQPMVDAVADRVARRERADIMRRAEKGGLDEVWVRSFYGDHTQFVRAALEPIAKSALLMGRLVLDIDAAAHAYAMARRDAVLELMREGETQAIAEYLDVRELSI